MHRQRADPGEDVFGGLLERPIEPADAGEQRTQGAAGDIREVGVFAARRQRDAVPQRGGEPGWEQVARSAHVLEAPGEWSEVGQRLVDVEKRDRRSGGQGESPSRNSSSAGTMRSWASSWREC